MFVIIDFQIGTTFIPSKNKGGELITATMSLTTYLLGEGNIETID